MVRQMNRDKPYEFAVVKFNGGSGALLCNKCNVIIAHGLDHEDKYHYCDKCTYKQVRTLVWDCFSHWKEPVRDCKDHWDYLYHEMGRKFGNQYPKELIERAFREHLSRGI